MHINVVREMSIHKKKRVGETLYIFLVKRREFCDNDEGLLAIIQIDFI